MGVKQLFKTSVYMAFRHILHTVGILAVVLLIKAQQRDKCAKDRTRNRPHFKIKLKCIHKFMEDIAPEGMKYGRII